MIHPLRMIPLCRMQAVFSVGTVILYVVNSYYWETEYLSVSMKLEVRLHICFGFDSNTMVGIRMCRSLIN